LRRDPEKGLSIDRPELFIREYANSFQHDFPLASFTPLSWCMDDNLIFAQLCEDRTERQLLLISSCTIIIL